MLPLHSITTILCLSTIIGVISHPANVKYDQRQEGDWNVRADLENFVILLIPSSQGAPSGGLGLLDLLTKAMPFKNKQRKHNLKKVPQVVPTSADTEAFIESKTAPYHVDISRSKNNLAKLHPAQVDFENDEKLLQSPTVALLRNRNVIGRKGKMIDRPYHVLRLIKVDSSSLNKESKKEDVEGGHLNLLGAVYEQCGPDYERDSKGICRIKIHHN